MASFQQYTLVDSELMSRTPDNITGDQAATIPLGPITSVAGLFQQSGVAFPENGPTVSGKSILIIGGSSSLGQYGKFSDIFMVACCLRLKLFSNSTRSYHWIFDNRHYGVCATR